MIVCPRNARRRADAADAICNLAHDQDELWSSSGFPAACDRWRTTAADASAALDISSLVVYLGLCSGNRGNDVIGAASIGAFRADDAMRRLRDWLVPEPSREQLLARIRCVLFMWIARVFDIAVDKH